MRLSQSFVKTLKDSPKDETAKSAQFLLRAGYLYKELAGVYDYLPLGLRVIENIKNIIREELTKINGQEVLLSTLQNPELWQLTDRWDSERVDIWFKTNLSAGGELGLAPTHEEPLTNLLKTYVKSYKDLPLAIYQFQTKFRNELRAKSGIMRTREFIMKDLYSFHTSVTELDNFYQQVEAVYETIFQRLNLGDCTFKTFASGGVFSKYSHEYQTILPIGEDTIYYNPDKSIVLNEEVLNDEVLADLHVKREELTATHAAEVGNIFKLMTKYSTPLGLKFSDQNNLQSTVFMGCYGIGVSRLMGIIAERFADEKGLVWPENIAPFKYYLIGIGNNGEKAAQEFYQSHSNLSILDDRGLRPGEKFADADLIGLPFRLVFSDKTITQSSAERTNRLNHKTELLPISKLENA